MSKTINWLENQVHYSVYGEGDPVILLHGFGEDARVFDKQVDALKHKYKLIVPFLPGSGPSHIEEETEKDITITTMADMVNLLAEAEDIAEFVLLGHSMGGYITLNFASRFPEKLKGFGLIHSTAFADNDEKKASRKKAIDFIGQHGSLEFFKTSVPGLFGPDFGAKHPEVVEEMVSEGKNYSPGVLQAYYKTMMERPDSTDVLKQADVPVLIVAGEYDKAAPLNDLLEQAQLAAHTSFHIQRHSGHMSMLEEPELLNEIIEKFLDSI